MSRSGLAVPPAAERRDGPAVSAGGVGGHHGRRSRRKVVGLVSVRHLPGRQAGRTHLEAPIRRGRHPVIIAVVDGPVERASATKRIAVTAHQVFLAVTDPACHVRIDGSGMLQNAGGARRLKAPGDTFDIEMDRQPLGDVAGLEWLPRYYTVRNIVTRIVPDRLLEWAPALAGKAPTGRVYGWQIEPVSDTSCDVTNYCDWHAVSDELRARLTWPVVPISALERSIENLARTVTRA